MTASILICGKLGEKGAKGKPLGSTSVRGFKRFVYSWGERERIGSKGGSWALQHWGKKERGQVT